MGRSKRKLTTIHVGESCTEARLTTETNDVNVEDTSGNATRKRTKTQLEDIWKLPTVRRIPVEANRNGQPIGEEAQSLSSYSGVLVRANCPLNYKNWRKVPPGTKNHLIKLLKLKFIYPAAIDKWVNKSMAKKLGEYKCYLKGKFFDRLESVEVNLENCPPDVKLDQWQYLVDFWMSDDGKKIEKTARNSRACQKVTHITGSKSFARKKAELDMENGKEVGGIKFFEVTHIRVDGTVVDPEVNSVLEKAKVMAAERTTPSEDVFMEEIQILSSVMGPERPGRVRGLGLGPTKTTVFGPRVSSVFAHTDEDFDNMQAQLDAQSHEIKNLKDQLAMVLKCVKPGIQAASTENKEQDKNVSQEEGTRTEMKRKGNGDVGTNAQRKSFNAPWKTTKKVDIGGPIADGMGMSFGSRKEVESISKVAQAKGHGGAKKGVVVAKKTQMKVPSYKSSHDQGLFPSAKARAANESGFL